MFLINKNKYHKQINLVFNAKDKKLNKPRGKTWWKVKIYTKELEYNKATEVKNKNQDLLFFIEQWKRKTFVKSEKEEGESEYTTTELKYF